MGIRTKINKSYDTNQKNKIKKEKKIFFFIHLELQLELSNLISSRKLNICGISSSNQINRTPTPNQNGVYD
jgi:hypothetical protein